MESYSILLVDDEKNILRSLKRLFTEEGYTIFTAESGEQGLEIMKNENVDMIISDQKMPGMQGLEFLEKTVDDYPEVLRIILTGNAELHDAIRAVNNGAVYKFILKPWNDEDLKITIRRAFEQYYLIKQNNDLTNELKRIDKILIDLEKQYPGITQRPKNGVYEIKT